MTYVVDASVFVAASRPEEANYATSRGFLRALRADSSGVFCPTLVIAECAAAIARQTSQPGPAGKIVTLIMGTQNMKLIDVMLLLAEKAAQIATQHHLRGADAIYVALAVEVGATLVTWDNEMLQRGALAAKTITPTDWLT